MPDKSNSDPIIPPEQVPPATDLALLALRHPSTKEHSELAQRVAVLESEMKHLAKREDLEKVKTWTMTLRNSGLMALAAALGGALVTMIATTLKLL